jgi:hypothetical protein
MIKTIIKSIGSRIKYNRCKRWMARRASSMAVALVCNGSLQPASLTSKVASQA